MELMKKITWSELELPDYHQRLRMKAKTEHLKESNTNPTGINQCEFTVFKLYKADRKKYSRGEL